MLLLHHLIPLQCKLYRWIDQADAFQEGIRPKQIVTSFFQFHGGAFKAICDGQEMPLPSQDLWPEKIIGTSLLCLLPSSPVNHSISAVLVGSFISCMATSNSHTYHYPDTPCRCDEMGCAPYAHIAFWRSLGWSMMKYDEVSKCPKKGHGPVWNPWNPLQGLIMDALDVHAGYGSPLKCSSLSDHIWVLLLELLIPGSLEGHWVMECQFPRFSKLPGHPKTIWSGRIWSSLAASPPPSWSAEGGTARSSLGCWMSWKVFKWF